jgi:hypothetical protein
LTLDHVNALTRQQQRIAYRSALIHYLLAVEEQGARPSRWVMRSPSC